MLDPVNVKRNKGMPSFFLDAAKPFYDVLRVSPLVYVQNCPKFCV